jgi:hypothetical protein
MKTKCPSPPLFSWRLKACFSALWLSLAWCATRVGDVVTDWNDAALDAIRVGKTPPPKASRALAILHAAIFDAVNGVSLRYEIYLVPSAVTTSASPEAAASAAGHQVLLALFPDAAAGFDALHAETLAQTNPKSRCSGPTAPDRNATRPLE